MKYIFSFLLSVLVFGSCRQSENTNKAAINYYSNVEEINLDDLKELVRNRNGKILFINLWATWCVPCKEEFPDLVKIAEKYSNEDVDIIGISADMPEELNEKIIPFLKEQNVNFKNFVKNTDSDDDFINYLNTEWSGSLPATFIYDKDGNQKKFLLGKYDFAKFDKSIQEIK